MDMLEGNFDLLQQALGSTLSFFNTLRLTTARLYLQCNYFLEETLSDQRREGILRAYSTAVSLITKSISHSTACEELPYAPSSTSRMILVAALVIFRVLHSSYAVPATPELDRNAGHVLYRAACLALRQLSVQNDEKDFPTRGSEFLNELWQWAEADAELRNHEPTFHIRSRMGSSLVYDCVSMWRKYKRTFDQQSRSSTLQTPSTANTNQHQPLQESGAAAGMENFFLSDFDCSGDWDQLMTLDSSEDANQNFWQDWGIYGAI